MIWPFWFRDTSPGLISIWSPTFRTPQRMLPPTMPPFIWSTSSPGLLMSKDLVVTLVTLHEINWLPDDYQLGTRAELSPGNRDVLSDVLAHGVDVVVQLRRYRDYRRVLRPGSLDELLDLLVVLRRSVRVSEDQIHFVLNYDDFVQLHYFDRRQMLARLRLRTSHVSSS